MENINPKILTPADKHALLQEYKELLKIDPLHTLKSFCKERGIKVTKFNDWMHRHGISVKRLQAEARGEDPCLYSNTFIQFKAGNLPAYAADTLKGVSITFADGVNLTLQESSVENVVSLLTVYGYRNNGGSKICSD